MTNLLALLFDGGLSILLMVTIGYCARLNRRIRVLQDSRSELAGMITQFDQATGRAMTSLAELQTTSKRITEALQLKIDKANFMADDLAFLIEKSGKLSQQLDSLKNPAQPTAPKPAVPAPAVQTATQAKPKPSTFLTPPSAQDDLSSTAKSSASLEALLSRLAFPPGEPQPAIKPAPRPAMPKTPYGPRTDAERELLEALKSSH